jgi:ubiquinone/menaquinone biosynthesis C-methylase UbiE
MTTAKDAQFWDRTAERYARSPIADQVGYDRTLVRTRDYLTSGDRVLELGCGTGTTALRLAANVDSYLATDVSSEMIGIARNKQADASVPGLRFETATAESLPEINSFNAIIGFNYLHLVRDLTGTLRRIHNLLQPGGVFISKTPCVGDMNVLIRLALPVMRAIGKAPYAGVFRAAELRRHVELTGFDVIAVENHSIKGSEIRPYIVAHKQ